MVGRLAASVMALMMVSVPWPALAQGTVVAADQGTGPYPAKMEFDPSLPEHMVYRPRDLASVADRRLGVFLWGNGGCSENAESASAHLLEIASHGYLVIAPGVLADEAAKRRRERDQANPGVLLLNATVAADLVEGLDWALAQDQLEGGKYRGLIDRSAIAVAGHSCGGIQALEAAADPRVRAVIANNSGIWPDEGEHIVGMELRKSALEKLHTPVLYLMGDTTDMAWPNGTDDFNRIDKVPAMLVSLAAGHEGTFAEPHGGAAAAISVDWLEWQLRGDESAGRTFIGENCRICGVPSWSITRKGFKIGSKPAPRTQSAGD